MNNLPRLYPYLRLLRLHQPIGIFLLLWPTLWALWVANRGFPHLRLAGLFITGVLLTRSLGCVVNDMADRKFDGQVTRTKKRPLATGDITVKEAGCLFIALSVLAFVLVWQLNVLTIKLAFIGLGLACFYPYSKRFTHWPQLLLGFAFSWSIPMVFAAQTGKIPPVAWMLFIAGSLWSLAYDTMYAMVDRYDDKQIGVKSTAVLFKSYDTLFIAITQLLFIVQLVLIGMLLKLYRIYYLMLGLSAILLVYQQYLLKDRKPEHCFKAFLNNAWVGVFIFIGFALGFTLP